MQPLEFRPRLACRVAARDGSIVLSRDELEFALEPEASDAAELKRFLDRLDGRRTVGEIQRELTEDERRRFASVLEDLDRCSLLDDAAKSRVRTGSQALLDLEDMINARIEQTLDRNVYWENVLGEPGRAPANAFYGLAIENYHFLFRESLFDSPVLPFVANTKARMLMNEFYCSEYGHDELVMRALEAIGITRAEMADAMPLPETLALCNALSYWAGADPLFFFATLGVLEGKDVEVDRYIEACEKNQLPKGFVGPMKQHSDINRKAEHGNLTRLIFAEIPFVDDATFDRMKRQMRLFIDMYDDFYTAIWKFYSTTPKLVRRISAI